MNTEILMENPPINKTLNPAFTGFLIAQFLKEHCKKNSNINSSYIFLVLPFIIHPKYRSIINRSQKKNFLALIEDNRPTLENFDSSVHYFISYTYEGLYFLLKTNIISLTNGKIVFNKNNIKTSVYSPDINNEIKASKKLAILLSNKFDTITIYNILGITL